MYYIDHFERRLLHNINSIIIIKSFLLLDPKGKYYLNLFFSLMFRFEPVKAQTSFARGTQIIMNESSLIMCNRF